MSLLAEWLQTKCSANVWVFVKRLSANDTGATKSHQSGLYMPGAVIDELFPSLRDTQLRNPEALFSVHVSSHPDCPDLNDVRAIYYNNKFFGGTRDEKRLTGFGKQNPLQNPENTGALALLAFDHMPGTSSSYCDVWVCKDLSEEEILEPIIGEVIPGATIFGPGDKIIGGFVTETPPGRTKYKLPPEWNHYFPSGREIIGFAACHYDKKTSDPDTQLTRRRKIEFEIFLAVEELHVLGQIAKGFATVNDFITLANSVSNRRKSRAGKSLELHLESLFTERGATSFETQATTEGKKKPDFIFPSGAAYRDPDYPAERLRMLGVKTTCKDRWRQVLNEANRIDTVHLFTLQQGVSVAQFREMQAEGIRLVVPEGLHKAFPEEIRGELMSLSAFINEIKELYS
ncbi:type II restriction endonuclease [Klebsiella pneumoniae]|uniref:type II restriction endonuclease n=1 Tax=Klebsiella pneumoniae TaxID=573 RepID=UPI003983D187